MGMFDSVFAACPSCGELVEFQSKAGPCDLKRYLASSVPAVIAMDLMGERENCRKCGGTVSLMWPQVPDRVRMEAFKPRADDGEDSEGWD